MTNMLKGFVCVPSSDQSYRIRDKLVKFPALWTDNTVSLVSKPDNDENYDIVMAYEIIPAEIYRLIEYVIEQIPEGHVWIQYETRGGLFVREYLDGKQIYEMNGNMERGSDLEDNVREDYEGLNVACENRKTDFLEYKNDDEQVFIRRFKDNKTIEIMNGAVAQDDRTEKDHYMFYVNWRR